MLAMDELVEVTIPTASSQRTVRILKRLLCDASPYFSNAFDGHFIESGQRAISLQDDHPEAAAVFLYWLQHQVLLEHDVREYSFETLKAEIDDPFWTLSAETLVQTWVFGDKYRISKMQNLLMKVLAGLFSSFQRPLEIPLVQVILAMTTQDSPLRLAAVMAVALRVTGKAHNPKNRFGPDRIEALFAVPGFGKQLVSALLQMEGCHSSSGDIGCLMNPRTFYVTARESST